MQLNRPVEGRIHTAGDNGKAGVGVADFGVGQENLIEVFPHLIGDVVGPHHVINEIPIAANAVLNVLVLILRRHKVDEILLQGVPLAVPEIRHGNPVRYLPLPCDALRPERTDTAQPGGVRPLLCRAVRVNHGAAPVLVDILLVVGLTEIELSVILHASAQRRLGGFGTLRPLTQGRYAVLVRYVR